LDRDFEQILGQIVSIAKQSWYNQAISKEKKAHFDVCRFKTTLVKLPHQLEISKG